MSDDTKQLLILAGVAAAAYWLILTYAGPSRGLFSGLGAVDPNRAGFLSPPARNLG